MNTEDIDRLLNMISPDRLSDKYYFDIITGIVFSNGYNGLFFEDKEVTNFEALQNSLLTLKYYAKIDSPDLYQEFLIDKSNEITANFNGSSHINENELAEILEHHISDEFIVVGRETYKYNGSYLMLDPGNYSLSEKIRELISDRNFLQKIFTSDISINSIIKRVSHLSFIKKITAEMIKFLISKIKRIALSDNKLACKDKVLLIQNDKLRFVDGTIEDFLFDSSEIIPNKVISYAKSKDNRMIRNINSFLDVIFTSSEEKDNALSILSTLFLDPSINNKIFICGSPASGKSTLVNLLKGILGYSVKNITSNDLFTFRSFLDETNIFIINCDENVGKYSKYVNDYPNKKFIIITSLIPELVNSNKKFIILRNTIPYEKRKQDINYKKLSQELSYLLISRNLII